MKLALAGSTFESVCSFGCVADMKAVCRWRRCSRCTRACILCDLIFWPIARESGGRLEEILLPSSLLWATGSRPGQCWRLVDHQVARPPTSLLLDAPSSVDHGWPLLQPASGTEPSPLAESVVAVCLHDWFPAQLFQGVIVGGALAILSRPCDHMPTCQMAIGSIDP